ncbi:TetR family transcriptional regulator [Actinomycetospora sp. NBRC 106375]|uniref:TetR/AcrR family transcriptional regulator n=1 Tax=Actinomycetospora sp. NBRC 106375 TaxID=3032207 RepID=UPI0024A01CED|nr:TetR/AcrR family transcriptional regulator [Actinomycetospora sp. NBRC 106375]GLZ46995.1 TetR family transcriptional regulator [Actinomycetospora sp. NBRC 106375]
MTTARKPTSERRTEIVSAAAGIVADQGYAAVGMRDIADAIGIRGASLYHHFSSKEEILYAICLTVTQEPCEQNLPLLDAPGTPGERLTALIRAHIRHLLHRRVEYMVGLHERPALSPEHRAEIDDYVHHYNRRVRDVLAEGMRSGEFRALDPGITALGILDMLNGVSGWIRGTTCDDTDDVVATYTALLFTGLRP